MTSIREANRRSLVGCRDSVVIVVNRVMFPASKHIDISFVRPFVRLQSYYSCYNYKLGS